MSGGSFNYLADAVRLCERAEDVRAITVELARIHDKHPEVERAYYTSLLVLRLLEDAERGAAKLAEVWHAVEWHVSNDLGEEEMLKVLRAFKGGA